MPGQDEDAEDGVSRRGLLAALGITTTVTAGSGLWIAHVLSRQGERQRNGGGDGNDYTETEYPPGTSDGGTNGGDYRTREPGTTTGSDPIDSWDEAVPGGCSLSGDQRHWLVEQVDSYDDMNGDDFFEYVDEGRVDLGGGGFEIRMLVDEDNDGRYDQGYNVPDVC
jgi:hypothetical protein